MQRSIGIRTNDPTEASSQIQRAFLDRYVFRGLGGKRVASDVPSILHFTPNAFLHILERCHRFGVAVHGIEMFTAVGEPIHTQLSRDGAPNDFLLAVVPFCRFPGVTVCASFGVPEVLLKVPAISPDLLAAYRASEYHVLVNGRSIAIAVEQRSVELEQLLREHSSTGAYLITACAPFSRDSQGSDGAITAALELDLKKAGAIVLPAVAAQGSSWEESGFLAMRFPEADARRLGEEYGQNALLDIQADGMARLMLLR